MPTRNDGPVSSADAGSSCIDRQTFRAWLTPRIGRSAANGQFEVLLESREPIAPDPYLVQPSPRFASSRVPIGRKYFNCHRLADLSNTELVIDGRNSVVPGGSSVSRYQLRQPFADMDILVRPIARGQCADHGAAHPWALARFDHRTRGEACGVTGAIWTPNQHGSSAAGDGAIGLASLSGTSQDKRATVSNSKPEDADANTLFILCRPGLFLGSDDPELVQRECSVLAWPDRTNRH